MKSSHYFVHSCLSLVVYFRSFPWNRKRRAIFFYDYRHLSDLNILWIISSVKAN